MKIKNFNEVYAIIEDIDDSIKFELSDYFSFEIPGARYMPAFKKGWDGKLRLYNKSKSILYKGLLSRLEEFAKDKNYYIEFDSELEYTNNFSLKEAEDFIKKINPSIEPRDYQIEGFVQAVRNNRVLFLSPTSSR